MVFILDTIKIEKILYVYKCTIFIWTVYISHKNVTIIIVLALL